MKTIVVLFLRESKSQHLPESTHAWRAPHCLKIIITRSSAHTLTSFFTTDVSSFNLFKTQHSSSRIIFIQSNINTHFYNWTRINNGVDQKTKSGKDGYLEWSFTQPISLPNQAQPYRTSKTHNQFTNKKKNNGGWRRARRWCHGYW